MFWRNSIICRTPRPRSSSPTGIAALSSNVFHFFEDDDGWGWRLVDDIGDTIAEGGDRHDTEAGAGKMEDMERRVLAEFGFPDPYTADHEQ